MIRDGLRRLAHEALHRLEQEQDASQLRIYSAPWVVPGGSFPIRDGAVVLDAGGQVLACGRRDDLLPRFRWAHHDELPGVLLPGLVDAQTRLELGEVRDGGLTGLGVARRLRALREIARATEELDPDSREARIRNTVRRSVDAGTAAVGDLTDSLRAVPTMSREGLYGVVFHEIQGFSKRRAAKALAAAAVQRAGIVPWPDGIRYRLAPHALYSTATSVVRELFARAVKQGAITAIRLAETEEELDLFGEHRRTRALLDAMGSLLEDQGLFHQDLLQSIEDLGGLSAEVLLVGMRAAPRALVERAGAVGAPVVLTPRADLQRAGSPPPLINFLEEGCRLALGTESPAASPEGSVLREAAELHAAFPEVPAMVLIRAATEGGADALDLPTMGSLEPGRSPGLVLARADSTPDDPCAWLLEETPQVQWIARPAKPLAHAA